VCAAQIDAADPDTAGFASECRSAWETFAPFLPPNAARELVAGLRALLDAMPNFKLHASASALLAQLLRATAHLLLL
jgi:hypothetical protein